MPQTHYQVLGVGRDATTAEIDRAFRKLAKQLHPDVPGGNAEDFKRLSEAHIILRDPSKRGLYDLQSNFQEPTREPASRAEIWINTLASFAFAAIGILFWVWGDKPGEDYNGLLVALGWATIFYAVGVFVERKYGSLNPLTIAKSVLVYLIFAALGLALSFSVWALIFLGATSIVAVLCWIAWLFS